MPTLKQPTAFLATINAEQSRDFYVDRLGLSLVGDEPFALVFDAGGTMLRIQKVEELTPARHTVLGWAVDDIEVSINELTAKGIAFARYDHIGQDELGVWNSPSGARIAWFKDPDGNVLSLTQHP